MPKLEQYEVEVELVVRLKANDVGVSSYAIRRSAVGASAAGGVTPAASGMSGLVEQALVKAVAAEKALRAGMQNAEARRLK